MMKYVSLPDPHEVHILPFYLSMEEYVARLVGDDDLFFTWQVEPTVIFGRNQLMANEVNVDYCCQHDIAFYRRRSGGGCVYADMDNVMMSYITCSDDVQTTFARYTGAVAAMLRDMGLDASDNSRNDVLIGDRKVSGNSFYHLSSGISIVHGTMLVDTDMEHMLHALTPSHAKLDSKGVASVRNRVTTLREHLPSMTAEAFRNHARDVLCDGEVLLNDDDVHGIEDIMQGYLDPAFLNGSNPRCSLEKHAHIDGVGDMTVRIDMNHDIVTHIALTGDYFALADDIEATLNACLKGVALEHDALQAALSSCDMSRLVMNLENNQFINLLTN